MGSSVKKAERCSGDCRMTYFDPLGAFDMSYCKSSMLHNIFFINNQQPVGGCYTISWSLAVQMQFWCLFPLLLVALQPHILGFR